MRQIELSSRQFQFSPLNEEGSMAVAKATAALAMAAHKPVRIYLHGGLGAGKTTWVRFFLQACGITGRIKSPSFSVLETYHHKATVFHHLDFYRQSDPLAWQSGGLREVMLEPGIVLVEWPEHAAGLPAPQIELWLDWAIENQADGPRRLRIHFLGSNAPDHTDQDELISDALITTWRAACHA
jgi:tRNA threonylcarbamoyl adenosine modification protein YjeE